MAPNEPSRVVRPDGSRRYQAPLDGSNRPTECPPRPTTAAAPAAAGTGGRSTAAVTTATAEAHRGTRPDHAALAAHTGAESSAPQRGIRPTHPSPGSFGAPRRTRVFRPYRGDPAGKIVPRYGSSARGGAGRWASKGGRAERWTRPTTCPSTAPSRVSAGSLPGAAGGRRHALEEAPRWSARPPGIDSPAPGAHDCGWGTGRPVPPPRATPLSARAREGAAKRPSPDPLLLVPGVPHERPHGPGGGRRREGGQRRAPGSPAGRRPRRRLPAAPRRRSPRAPRWLPAPPR